jgi:hypothetical protein
MKPYLGIDPDSNNLMKIASDCRSERVANFSDCVLNVSWTQPPDLQVKPPL